MYNRILVPLDGSEVSECSISHVRDISRGNPSAEVTLLTVLEEPTFEYDEPTNESQAKEMFEEWSKTKAAAKRKAEEYLARSAEFLSKAGVKAKTAAIKADVSNRVPDTILGYAEKYNFDLIVLSTHGRSGISRWAFGSVADKVVHTAKLPVLSITPAGCRL